MLSFVLHYTLPSEAERKSKWMVNAIITDGQKNSRLGLKEGRGGEGILSLSLLWSFAQRTLEEELSVRLRAAFTIWPCGRVRHRGWRASGATGGVIPARRVRPWGRTQCPRTAPGRSRDRTAGCRSRVSIRPPPAAIPAPAGRCRASVCPTARTRFQSIFQHLQTTSPSTKSWLNHLMATYCLDAYNTEKINYHQWNQVEKHLIAHCYTMIEILKMISNRTATV